MSEKPILFSAEMVRAILNGRKTQTRRVVRAGSDLPSWATVKNIDAGLAFFSNGLIVSGKYELGDRLWVRETWGGLFDDMGVALQWKDCRKKHRTEQRNLGVMYKATDDDPDYTGCWVSPLFMPRWASRITLNITDVRCERLQDISETDAQAEGVAAWHGTTEGTIYKPEYRLLWNKISGTPKPIYDNEKIVGYKCYPWSAEDFDAMFPGMRESGFYRGKPIAVTPNPWVWVVEFKKVAE